MRRTAREVAGLFGETLHRCVLHSVDTQSAALAFYSLLALAPALLAVVSIGGRFLTQGRVHSEIARQLRGVMGPVAGRAVVAVLDKVSGPGSEAGPGGVAGTVVLLLGMTAVFLQLQEALNRVWEISPRPGALLRELLKRRVVSFALVLAAGLLLLVSLTVSASLLALADLLADVAPFPVALITIGNEVLSFAVLTVLLALVYRVLPDAKLEWRDVGIGAVVTVLLFSAGKWVIGFVLGWTAVASRFGIVGSMVAILLWVYYESYVLLFGAELTAAYARRFLQRPVTPETGATRSVPPLTRPPV